MNKEKKIAHLHLYLGCEVKTNFNDLTYILIGVEGDNVIIWRKGTGRTVKLSHTVKPLLRPLSDMTDAECEEYGMMHSNGAYHSDTLEFDSKIGLSSYYIGTDNAAERIRMLLAAGFDLFGLIEAGLAIDKSTLK